jgi:HAD superfamily hydrolase (TIGR01509 family)
MHKDKLIPIPEYIQGLIFDCDGTLVDSMPLHMEAWQFVVEQFGGTFHYDFFFSKKGMKETEIVDLYNQRFGMQIPREDIVAAKHQYILQHIHNIKPIDIVADVVNFFKTRLPMSVVSGSSREIVLRELQAAGLENLFHVILTADDSFKQKPEPDMFLEAARVMNVPPSQCQVFEDGDLGLSAAYAAGMLAIDVRPYILCTMVE